MVGVEIKTPVREREKGGEKSRREKEEKREKIREEEERNSLVIINPP